MLCNCGASFHFRSIFANSLPMEHIAQLSYCSSVYPAVDLGPSSIISEVLEDVEKRSFTAQDPDDGMNFNISDNLHCLNISEESASEFQVVLASWKECVQLAFTNPF